MSAARTNYSDFSQDPRFSGRKIQIPKNNYLTGEVLSRTYRGPGWYVPHRRDWHMYHEHQHLPTLAHRDAIDFESQHDYVAFLRRRDIPKAPLIPAYITSKVTNFKVYAHERDLKHPPITNNNETVPPFTQWDGPGYHGCYHELLNRHRAGEFRRLPIVHQKYCNKYLMPTTPLDTTYSYTRSLRYGD